MTHPGLIVVLPGIGGSVLTSRRASRERSVWDAGVGSIAGTIFHPARLSLAEEPHLVPTGLISTTKFLGFTVAAGYDSLLRQFSAFGRIDRAGDPQQPVMGAAVVAVPYDFRRSLLQSAERLDDVVRAHLAGISETDRLGRVTIVAHSMGGLVARVWMALLGRWRWCRSLITLGTPHRGAPKALHWIVNGMPLLNGVTSMLRGWPSVTELLPRYRAIMDVSSSEALYPHELPIPWLSADARRAYALHIAVEQAWDNLPRRGPEVVACMGWSHRTMNAAYWSDGELQVTKDHPSWLDLVGWEQDFGDGTVPSYSALPAEMDNYEHSPVRLLDRHVPLAATPVAARLVERQLRRVPPRRVHGPGRGRTPALGLDVEDVHLSGSAIPFEASVRGVDSDLSDLVVWGRLQRDGRLVETVRLSWHQSRRSFVGQMGGKPPGMYELQVQLREVPGAGDLHTTDTLAVVDET